MKARRNILLVVAVLLPGLGVAQPRREAPAPATDFWGEAPENGSVIRGEGGILIDESTVRTARETASHSTGTPEWSNPPGFEKDVFTFARVMFHSDVGTGDGWGRGIRLSWWVDYPED